VWDWVYETTLVVYLSSIDQTEKDAVKGDKDIGSGWVTKGGD